MKICVAGEGAFGTKHIEALCNIESVEVSWLVGGEPNNTQAVAEKFNIANWSCDLSDALNDNDIAGVVLATPTPIHAAQAKQVMLAGKHVLVEIPMADNLADALELVAIQKQTGVIAMAGHVRRFNPSHQWIHNKIQQGELKIQQMDVQTYFYRRSNTNAKGEPRSWTDHLLWHHACHSVDLFQYQTGQQVSQCYALQGPIHAELGIAMDMSIGMKVPDGALCTLSLSFNNDGPFGTFFRYICDEGTFTARYDDLFNSTDNPIDLSQVAISSNGIELIDREFIQAISSGCEPNSSLQQCLGAMETLHKLEQSLCP
ncbi:Gfo/Idh/MocA family oxidoreductase [Paraglaciecola arctica]|uniref:Gfo/Idh/MocA family oxidoreductase n=1 Tax=Paraglaciecola arctica TaxID=1128911 RepID=UPI001C07BFFA|nr:Gfo/Idh/MocA family oxidoreductase [Paraglaciecola arctica]MBU3002952.1 Gfo/Idh/MocA family oxidoreductase [Paraglaciecola arctica]